MNSGWLRVRSLTWHDYNSLIEGESLSTYLDTWSFFEAAKTDPWPSRGLYHCGKFLEPSDEPSDELVEDAIASWCGDIVGNFWLVTLRKICGTNRLKNMSLAVVSRLTQLSRSNWLGRNWKWVNDPVFKIHGHWNQYLIMHSFNGAYCCTLYTFKYNCFSLIYLRDK